MVLAKIFLRYLLYEGIYKFLAQADKLVAMIDRKALSFGNLAQLHSINYKQ